MQKKETLLFDCARWVNKQNRQIAPRSDLEKSLQEVALSRTLETRHPVAALEIAVGADVPCGKTLFLSQVQPWECALVVLEQLGQDDFGVRFGDKEKVFSTGE